MDSFFVLGLFVSPASPSIFNFVLDTFHLSLFTLFFVSCAAAASPSRSGAGHGLRQRGEADSAIRWRCAAAVGIGVLKRFSNPSAFRLLRLVLKRFKRAVSFVFQSGRTLFFLPFIRAIAAYACYGLPPLFDGSLDERRRGQLVLVLLVLCGGLCQRGRHGLQIEQRQSAEFGQSCQRSLRALRPASAEAAFLTDEAELRARSDNLRP